MLIHMNVTLDKIGAELYIIKIKYLIYFTLIYFYVTGILSDELMQENIAMVK